MKIKRLELKNFKRFTNLVIEDIPETAKLVLLIGANGSGKSSVFDAFESISQFGKNNISWTENDFNKNSYYTKNSKDDYKVNIELRLANGGFEKIGEGEKYRYNEEKTSFYGRSSLRQVPRLVRKSLGQQEFSIENDSDRPQFYIDRDLRFENDLELVVKDILNAVFVEKNAEEVISSYIRPINDAFSNIFGNDAQISLQLKSIIPPLDNNTFQVIFQKGNSQIHYNLLSSGEKEVFNILINLLTRRQHYQDTIYFFDEMDLHLNTTLQEALLKEITENWIPEYCQLWTASHSLGFIKYANESENACIIDFDNYDFDQAQTLVPQPKNNLEIFEIAVEKSFIDKLLKGKKIVYAENQNTPIYNNLLIENTIFFKAMDKGDVFHKAKNFNQFGLIDRDYLADEEIIEIKNTYPFLKILPYYCFENLLYHPDNLDEYYQGKGKEFDKKAYINALIDEKNKNREEIVFGVNQARNSYPFYKENENIEKLKKFRENSRNIIEILRTDDIKEFYKVFSAKDYGKQALQRQHIPKTDLAKTKWFKGKIEETLNS